MRVTIWSIGRAGSVGYLAGSWMKPTLHLIILIDVRENEMFKNILLY